MNKKLEKELLSDLEPLCDLFNSVLVLNDAYVYDIDPHEKFIKPKKIDAQFVGKYAQKLNEIIDKKIAESSDRIWTWDLYANTFASCTVHMIRKYVHPDDWSKMYDNISKELARLLQKD